jgi:hypothetical protein
MTAGPDPAALADDLAALAAASAAAEARAAELAARLAVLEQLAPADSAAPAPSTARYRYGDLADWVDEVFARLAAGHRARWCTSWDAHPEAVIRLTALWHTWESAMAAGPGADPDWAQVDDWLRVRLDHHIGYLLDQDGPFAGCVPARGTDPGRCAAPPRLAQRPLAVVHAAAVAELRARRSAAQTAGAPR